MTKYRYVVRYELPEDVGLCFECAYLIDANDKNEATSKLKEFV